MLSAPGWQLAGYLSFQLGNGRGVVDSGALDMVVDVLRAQGSLHAFAAAHPEAVALEGRRTAFSVPAGSGRWVIRHYWRGGAIARWLGDRYLRAGRTRPMRELSASLAARARGIPTPRIVAAVVYHGAAFYRADLATEHVPGAEDLAMTLFGAQQRTAAEREAACSAAAALIRKMGERGVIHRDLNLKNILIQWTAGGPKTYLLDLDRCRVARRATPARAADLRRRLGRSVGKWEATTGRRLAASERKALELSG